MNEKNQRDSKHYVVKNLHFEIHSCNNQDQYKLYFFEQKINSDFCSVWDLLKWLNIQNIYFTVHYSYDFSQSIENNFINLFFYRKNKRNYPASGIAKQKYHSSDTIIQDIVAALDSSKYVVYKI